jgi:hypothetical protein
MKSGLVLAIATACIAFALSAGAQVQTSTTTTAGQSSQVVKVEYGEVLAVEGNDLIVRMADGSIRHFENIPESAKATVDGKQLGIHDLKPGMKLQRTITTTTTPQIVTTVETVTGKVWHVTPPLSVILTLENGTNQSFKIPKDQKFKVNGEMVDAFGLKSPAPQFYACVDRASCPSEKVCKEERVRELGKCKHALTPCPAITEIGV